MKRLLKSICGPLRWRALLLLFFLPVSATGAGELGSGPAGGLPPLADLTFSNFFAVGWNEPWTRRSRGAGTPDMSLLRVQTNFLAQLWRTDFSLQENLPANRVREIAALNETIEYAFNRRLMLAVVGSYRWQEARAGHGDEGPFAAAFVRLQWLDTATASVATTFRAGLPARAFGERQTTLALTLAGWQDLAPLGLSRVGLYYHLQGETFAGPESLSRKRNDLTYAISLAKTWTSRDAILGHATTFVEAYGRTDLDGAARGATLLTITPGIRATIAHRHILMFGVEFPLTDPQPFQRLFRLTYIFNF